MYLLAGECAALGNDTHAWQARLVDGLRSIIGMQAGISTVINKPAPNAVEAVMNIFMEPKYCSEVQRQVCRAYWKNKWYHTDPTFVAFSRLRGDVVVRRRHELVDARTWDRSMHRERVYHPGGLENIMPAGIFPPPQRGIPPHVFLCMRSTKDRPFTEREQAIVTLLCKEIRNMLGSRLRPACAVTLPSLSPRLQHTLQLLNQGLTEKEIAAQLGISPHTLHDYVKVLYRRFGVSSRVQLMNAVRLDFLSPAADPGVTPPAARP